jgi:hypothetical protein
MMSISKIGHTTMNFIDMYFKKNNTTLNSMIAKIHPSLKTIRNLFSKVSTPKSMIIGLEKVGGP